MQPGLAVLRENRNEGRCLELVLAFFFLFSLQPLVGAWLGVGTEPLGRLLRGCRAVSTLHSLQRQSGLAEAGEHGQGAVTGCSWLPASPP